MTLAVTLTGCHDIVEYENTAAGNFDALWTFIDTHYCYFDQKDIDWQAVGQKYRARASACRDQQALFNVMADMLAELRDGHVNLSSWFATSYYKKWWSDYPQNYNARIIEENYFSFDYTSLGPVIYGILPGHNIGYMHISTFSSGLGQGNIDAILHKFRACNGLIIDIRDNGGGELTNVEPYVRAFLTQTITAGYMIHKTGPGHNDFSTPYAYTYSPPGQPHTVWTKPVVVLTNRSTFSAANNFAAIMATLPQVTVVGDVTGGGGGMPISSEIPAGWTIRISACRILDPDGNDTENGISPTPGWHVDMDPQDAARGIDTILEAAIRCLAS